MTEPLNIGQMLSAQARLQPDRVGARDLERALTFRQWNERACRLAHALTGIGLAKGDRVAILAYNRLEWVEIYAAAAKAGIIAVPVNFRLTGPETQYIIENSGAVAIIAEDVLAATVDVIRDEAEHSLMSAAGLDEEDDMFAPVVKSARRRALWLGINLGTAFLAASVVDLFQTTLDKIVLLAVLMPVVPSMGGVAGTQSLTIITRAMALGQIDKSNAPGILRKELFVGLLNGIGWAIIVAVATYLWFSDWRIGAVIAGAMIINLAVAAIAGFSIPLVLKRMNIDPAIAGGVVLTTVTDVVGYMAFLGLGAWYLM